jgi:periplasmic protein CpxP/Spy
VVPAGFGVHLPNGELMTSKGLMMTVAAAAVAALSWVAVAHAQDAGGSPRRERGQFFGPGFGPGVPGGPGLGRLAETLGLSDEQKSQLDALRTKQRETLQPLMESARLSHEAFRAALDADSPDATAVGQAAIAMNAAEKKVRAAHEAAFAEMKSILTPEQAKKLEQAHERRGPHGPGGPRP